MGHHSAVKMLHSRVRLILDYVCAVQSGQLGAPQSPDCSGGSEGAIGSINQEILRDINSLCHTLPLISPDGNMSTSSSQQPFATEFHQVLCKNNFLRSINQFRLFSFNHNPTIKTLSLSVFQKKFKLARQIKSGICFENRKLTKNIIRRVFRLNKTFFTLLDCVYVHNNCFCDSIKEAVHFLLKKCVT